MKKEGSKYLILTSHAYSFFLMDDDTHKEHLFNPYIKDRRETVYHHSNTYIDDKRHGYLFYLAKRGRDFFVPLLENKVDGVKLTKEFRPDKSNLGPVIKIYEIL